MMKVQNYRKVYEIQKINKFKSSQRFKGLQIKVKSNKKPPEISRGLFALL